MDGNHPNWKALATSNLRWKVFVQERDQHNQETDQSERSHIISSFSGDEAKKIYENIVDGSSVVGVQQDQDFPVDSDFDEASTSSSVSKSDGDLLLKKFNARDTYKAMLHAQNNDIHPLREMLNNGLNVNTKDEHGWSLLMSASCAGSFDVVRMLLKCKARTGYRDGKGNTALYLATIKGHKRIVDLLIKSRKKSPPLQDDVNKASTQSANITEFFCDICQTTVKKSTRIQHETSIVHQFKCGSSNHKTVYGISPSNKGYQLLVNQGWNTEKGLGPKSSGSKFPVKTVLKRNREGLGASSKEQARISHFGPGDISAVERLNEKERVMRLKTIGKRERKKQQQRDMEKDIKIRRMLSEPDI